MSGEPRSIDWHARDEVGNIYELHSEDDARAYVAAHPSAKVYKTTRTYESVDFGPMTAPDRERVDPSAQPSAEELAEIEARANAATPGPWRMVPDGSLVCEDAGERHDLFHALPVPRARSWLEHRSLDFEEARHNARFASSARTDVPRLLATVRALALERTRHLEGLRTAIEIIKERDVRIHELLSVERALERRAADLELQLDIANEQLTEIRGVAKAGEHEITAIAVRRALEERDAKIRALDAELAEVAPAGEL